MPSVDGGPREDHYGGLFTNAAGEKFVVVAGGLDREVFSTVDSSEIFDVAAGEWSAGPSLPVLIGSGSSVQLDDTFVIVAGIERAIDEEPPPSASAKLFIFDGEQFVQLPALLTLPRKEATAIRLPAGTFAC